MDDHELTGLDVVTTAAPFDTQKGPVIGVLHEYALTEFQLKELFLSLTLMDEG